MLEVIEDIRNEFTIDSYKNELYTLFVIHLQYLLLNNNFPCKMIVRDEWYYE